MPTNVWHLRVGIVHFSLWAFLMSVHGQADRTASVTSEQKARQTPLLQSSEPLADPQVSMEDWDLAMRIRAALLTDPELAGHNLIVVVRGGLVELEGPVPNAALRERVRQMVSSVPGVRQWRDRLRIQAESWTSRLFPRRLPPVDQPWPWNQLLSGEQEQLGLGSSSDRVTLPQKQPGPAPLFRNLSLMPPIPDTTSSHPLGESPSGQIQPIIVLLEQHLREQWRFRNVHAYAIGRSIQLTGVLETPQDLKELYHLVSRLAPALPVQMDGIRILSIGEQPKSTSPP